MAPWTDTFTHTIGKSSVAEVVGSVENTGECSKFVALVSGTRNNFRIRNHLTEQMCDFLRNVSPD